MVKFFKYIYNVLKKPKKPNESYFNVSYFIERKNMLNTDASLRVTGLSMMYDNNENFLVGDLSVMNNRVDSKLVNLEFHHPVYSKIAFTAEKKHGYTEQATWISLPKGKDSDNMEMFLLQWGIVDEKKVIVIAGSFLVNLYNIKPDPVSVFGALLDGTLIKESGESFYRLNSSQKGEEYKFMK